MYISANNKLNSSFYHIDCDYIEYLSLELEEKKSPSIDAMLAYIKRKHSSTYSERFINDFCKYVQSESKS